MLCEGMLLSAGRSFLERKRKRKGRRKPRGLGNAVARKKKVHLNSEDYSSVGKFLGETAWLEADMALYKEK